MILRNSLAVLACLCLGHLAHADTICMPDDIDGMLEKDDDAVRFGTFNAFLNRNSEGDLIADLENPSDPQISAVAEIVQRVRPDVLLINEFDYDAAGQGIELFQRNFLGESQNGQQPIHYEYVFLRESNTGIPSGLDLNNDGVVGGPDDAFGFGFFPGQFAMVLLSRYPIDDKKSRTFQKFLWKDMPESLLPTNYYSEAAQDIFRLSSKSHWDVTVRIGKEKVHVLSAHPTPPVFDGPEDRNGKRNHDEIRFWADYISGGRAAKYIYDDNGKKGGLSGGDPFVILGDYNADPYDGDSTNNAIWQLLDHPDINAESPPGSLGGFEDTLDEGQANASHVGNPALDTGDFAPNNPGNLRVDYVLPSEDGLDIECGGVFWPSSIDDTRYLVESGFPVVSSDHHLVWQDLEFEDDKRGKRKSRNKKDD